MTNFRYLLGAGIIYLLTGCEALNPPYPGTEPEYSPTYPTTPDPTQKRYANGAIYNAETVLPLFETPRARHAGDLVTVILVEKTDAQKRAITRQRKNDKTQIVNATVMGRPVNLGGGYNFDFDLDANRKFEGEGQSVQNNKLAGSISVTVAKVLANGNMVVQGEKWIRINQGSEFVRLSGIIRPQDIRPDNSITSDRIANAKIAYGGVGQINNTNAQGWFARFIWGPLFPI
ncbi:MULTISPECIES: flagellar basal body L-ring protein FlgH [Legionella]|uniref:Flagellar L-ring protein n=2 Tax=Legionella TaxID=445 RepID=A0A0W0TT88_9GAMM|nr:MULTISPECIES: flagellar basal body L-ring protein FlgH [Legionella]KTC98726.1 flagellar basal body L-ring protein [Legionella feeleii]MCC5015756.1 flagellar basal body L-ring protein FlgH [Legionella sp. 31fI33]SPX62810.1 flagellar L-ring protein FlgH [Legionella feeleii]STX38148.1 flagellar L-ring protein FlgH [Legionella feeleii]STX42885.1 flagellar L-ring protein FlgH [Legionella donaldsonii]